MSDDITLLPTTVAQVTEEAAPTREQLDPLEQINSVSLNLKVKDLAFQLETRTRVSDQIIELACLLENTRAQLQATQSKLEAAIYRIGYLEARLEERLEEKES